QYLFFDKSSPKISLAQWSLHRSFEKAVLKTEDFASIAMDVYRIPAVEYVSSLYKKFGKDEKFWNRMKTRADNAAVENLLIMIDDEGDLGDPNEGKRNQAVENHIKWLNAARILNCHSIRVNAFGSGDRQSMRSQLVDGLGKLAGHGAEIGINVLIENHGLHSSDGSYISEIIGEVNNDFLGSLPDFGNWCLNAKWGSTQGGKCSEVYDPYKGVKQLLPFAKGVSAKSYDFDTDGNETTIDYHKMLQLVKSSGFDGYIGIEYEGSRLSEDMGIRATKSLIEQTWKAL
ncbi:MAG: TIM barrel protein, partial [Flavobacteriaceae bacterium]